MQIDRAKDNFHCKKSTSRRGEKRKEARGGQVATAVFREEEKKREKKERVLVDRQVATAVNGTTVGRRGQENVSGTTALLEKKVSDPHFRGATS